MTIDLNKRYVTKYALLKEVQDIDVYRFYIGEKIDLANKILSPLQEEKNPSFGFFVGSSGEICFRDFRLGSGDCIKFVQMKFGLSFFDAMSKIAIDFGVDSKFLVKQMDKTVKDYNLDGNLSDRADFVKKSNIINLGKRNRKWMAYDFAFWLQFGIDADTLQKYNVEPIDYIFLNGTPIKAEKHAYAFIEHKDGKETYKIYQPFSEKYKWINNHNSSVWQGWEQLPLKGEELVITKSLKDVMAIKAVTGVDSVSLQSESTLPKNHIMKELKSRFKKIWVLYDNDYDKDENWGRKYGEEFSETFFVPQIEISSLYKSKDFSDLVKNKGVDTATTILDTLMHQYDDVPY